MDSRIQYIFAVAPTALLLAVMLGGIVLAILRRRHQPWSSRLVVPGLVALSANVIGSIGVRSYARHLSFYNRSADYRRQNLTLARSERGITVSKNLRLRLLTQGSAAALEGVPNGVEQCFVAQWLREKLHRTSLHGLHSHRNIAVAGSENDWRVDPISCDEPSVVSQR